MRERLLTAFIGLTLLIITLLAVPRAYFLAGVVTQRQTETLERSATLMTTAIQARTDSGRPVDEAFVASLLGRAQGVRYESEGRTVASGLDVAAPDVLRVERPISGGSLTVVESRDVLDERISDVVLPLVITGLLLMVVAALVAFAIARWLARPFQELAKAAEELGSGRFEDVRIRRYSTPEADDIGQALSVSAERLATMLRHEREFAANASHQLRTPITAMRLQLEDLATWPETHPSVAQELTTTLGELDRLSAAITQYLDLARGKRRTLDQRIQLRGLLTRTAERWQPRAEAAGREVRVAAEDVTIVAQPGTIDQILDALVENALRHGRGVVELAARADEAYVVLSVADEGGGGLDGRIFQRGTTSGSGTGLGLALATELAHTVGGELRLGKGARTVFELRLPSRPGEPPERQPTKPRPIAAA